MALQKAGETTHFTVSYEGSDGLAGYVAATAVLAVCESDLAKLTLYMPSHSGVGGDPFLNPKVALTVKNDLLAGPGYASAQNFGYSVGNQSLIVINPFASLNVGITTDYAGFLFVAEMAELLMGFYGWDAASSQGEALSRVMAEELHPASSSNFVNTWLGFARPRPDYISRNEASVPGGIVRGDLDPIAYGCGILFIYFLRYQLNFSYYLICTAGGTLLSDKYRALSKASDDPATRLGALLDAHFGTGPVRLVGNNPFPLLEGTDRKVLLAFGPVKAIAQPFPTIGEAHVKPLFNCPAANYPFTEYGLTVTQTITATTVGLGFPVFNWKLNGDALFGSSSSGTAAVPVDVPQPNTPGAPIRENKSFNFDYVINTQYTAAGGSSTLTLTSHSSVGDYQVLVEASADESVTPSNPVSVGQSLVFHTRSIVYGGSYSADRTKCEQALARTIGSKVLVVFDALARLHNLPDPPPPNYITEVLQEAENIRLEVARIATDNHAIATRVAVYAGRDLGVPAHFFLKGARGGSGEVED